MKVSKVSTAKGKGKPALAKTKGDLKKPLKKVNNNNMKGVKVKLEMTQCIKCGGKMPVLRVVKYGYRSCVDCSSVQKVGGVAIANHKTGNEIQIMPKEDADRLYTLSQRQGYGVSKGIKGVRK